MTNDPMNNILLTICHTVYKFYVFLQTNFYKDDGFAYSG